MEPLKRHFTQVLQNTPQRSYKPRILIVDDELPVLLTLKRAMRKKFEIVVAINAEQALKSLSQQHKFAVIISDLHMPRINGIEFLKEAKRLSPSTSRIMLTGSIDQSVTLQAVNECQIFRFLQKPCSADEICNAIEMGVQSYEEKRSPHDEAINILQKFQSELKTSLTEIVTCAKFIEQEQGSNRKSTDFVSQILENGEGIMEKSDTILDLVAIHTLKYSEDFKTFNTHSLLKAVINPHRKLALAKGIRFELDIPATPLELNSDKRLLTRAFSGLIANAVKFSPIESTIWIHIGLSGEDHTHIKLEVKDEGSGFDTENTNTALQDINNANDNSTKSHNTGLGLPLAATTAEFLGGYLDLESKIDNGTIARLFIPTGCNQKSESL